MTAQTIITAEAPQPRCAECPNPLTGSATRGGKRKVFCSPACKAAHKHRKHVRGMALVALAQGWRKTRGAGDFGKFLFAEITALLDQYNAEDRDAGRLDPVEYAKTLVNYTAASVEVSGGKGFFADRFMDRIR